MKRMNLSMILAAGALAASGCREEHPSMKAVRTSGNTMVGMAGGAAAVPSQDFQDKEFSSAVAGLMGASKGEASSGLTWAASGLLSAAQLGQVANGSGRATAAEEKLVLLSSEVHSALSKWTTMKAAEKSATFDPSVREGEISAMVATAAKGIAQGQAKLAKVVADQAKLNADAKARNEQAAGFEREAVNLKDKTRGQSTADAMPTLERALEARKKSDELKLAASKLEADALLAEPRKLEINQEIEKLTRQSAAMERERAAVQKRSKDSGADAKIAAAGAAEALVDLSKLVTQLTDVREKSFEEAVSGAIKACEASAASARKAGNDGKLATAVAAHRLGDVQMVRVAEAKVHAALMAELAGANPELPDKAKYAEEAKKDEDAAKALMDEVKKSFENATKGYSSLSLKAEESRTTRDALVKQLSEAAGLAKDEEPAPKPEGDAAKDGSKDGTKGEPKPEVADPSTKPAAGSPATDKPADKVPDPK